MANATAASQYGPFKPVIVKAGTKDESVPLPRPSWIIRRLRDLGVIIMAELPPRSYWNPTMIGTWCSVITLVIALITIIAIGGFYVGIQYQQIQTLEERLGKAEQNAEKTKELELLNKPGH